MQREMEKGTYGDSARNRPECELRTGSGHVFDGAGEHVQYYSDSESLGSKKTKTRYINPAIYIESVEAHSATSLLAESCVDEADVTPHPHSTYRSTSTPTLSGRASSTSSGSVKRKSCRLDDVPVLEDLDPTPRNRTYREDGADTFRLSVASLSTTTTAKEERERNERKRQEAFQQWLDRKEQEKRENLRTQQVKRPLVPTTTPEQREESYRRWLQRKRAQGERRKADDIMQRYRVQQREEREREQREHERVEKLGEWARKKEEKIKEMKTREERRTARAAVENERRRSAGERAYRDWLRTSKNKPLPVPLNQGELSMRGSVSQMYINPVPWQSET